jgi:hypothetical protein
LQANKVHFSSHLSHNPTLHDLLSGPDESQTTINYHHLHVSSNDGMVEQEIHWIFGKLMDLAQKLEAA